MVQLQPKLLTAHDFIEHYGDDPQYELIDGELIDLEPTGIHEQVAGFIGRKLNVAIDQQNALDVIPYRCLIKLLGTGTTFRPDVIVLDPPLIGEKRVFRCAADFFPSREPHLTQRGWLALESSN